MNTLTRAQFKVLSYLAQATTENTVATVADSIGMSLIDTDALLKELTALGYLADLFAVTEAGIAGLQNLYIWGVAIVSVISALLFLLYPLTEKKMEELRAEYAEKGSIDL